MAKQKFPIMNIAIFVLVVTLFVSLFYVASYFHEKEEETRSENPITFCQPQKASPEEQKCYFTTHIHFFPNIRIFGEERTLPFEHGPLDRFHTHFEKNKAHWHALLPADPITKRPLQNLTLGELFDDFGIPFDNDRIYEFESGMINPKTGQPAELTVIIDDERIENPRDYVLNLKHEHKKIEIIFE